MLSTSFITTVAEELRPHISPEFDRFELVAALSETAKEMSGSDSPSGADYKLALAPYVKALPANHDEARTVIARDAAQALSNPGVLTDREKLDKARQALAEAEAEVEQAQYQIGARMAAIGCLEKSIQEHSAILSQWQSLDFDSLEKQALETIAELWGRPFESVMTSSRLSGALVDLSNAPHLRAAQAIAVPRLQAKIDKAKSELAELQPPAAPVAETVKPFRGKVTKPAPDELEAILETVS